MRYYSFLVLLWFCVGIAAQNSSYYIRSINGSVRVKKENEEKWRECSVSTIQQIELSDSVIADDDSELVIIRQNGSIKSVVSPELNGKRLLDDVIRDEDTKSGNMVAASNRKVEQAGNGKSGAYVTAKMSMRGTLTDIEQIDTLVSTVKEMIERAAGGNTVQTSLVEAAVASDGQVGDYVVVTNKSDKTYYINVLVCSDDGLFFSLYGDLTEETTTIDGHTFPFIAVAANGTLKMDAWRFYDLRDLRLVLVATEDVYNIVTFNSLLSDEGNGIYSERMAERIIVSNIK